MTRICLINPNHVSFQPRTLREADTLWEAGHQVRVVTLQTDPLRTEFDRHLMKTRGWRLETIDLRKDGPSRRRWLVEGVRMKLMRGLFHVGLKSLGVAVQGYLKGLKLLQELAAAEPADWFIAHTQAALPAAVYAAHLWGARVGFDCEDLLAYSGTDPAEIVKLIERAYLPKCDYISTPSRSIADALQKQYMIPRPIVLYNVFPLSLADGIPPPNQRVSSGKLRVYWFSQTIGPGRGIEEAVEAVAKIREHAELHLRGHVSKEYRAYIESLAQTHQLKVFFHPIISHEELFKTIICFDVGLALERPERVNQSLTTSNKVFSYLLVGLAIAATDTPGQREVMEQVPEAGFLYPAGDAGALAEGLRRWALDRQALQSAQQAAWDAARKRFCWDKEREKLFKALGLT